MKKLLNFSLALLVFVLFGCEECRSRRGAGSVEPDVTKRYFLATDRPMMEAPVKAAAVAVEQPAPVKPKPIATSGSGQFVISRIYPAPEFAIIQMEKTMPEEVEINKPFDYSISVKNLTNTVLTNVMVTEEIPKNFKYTSSEPVAKENASNLVWEIE